MARTRRWIWVMLFALVAAQTLALVHRISHTGTSGATSIAASGWAAALQDGHADDPSCQVFDQASQALLCFGVPAPLLPVMLPSQFIQWSLGEAVARWAALFDARG